MSPKIHPLSIEQYNEAVDLWNAGKDTSQIATALGINVYDLHPLVRAGFRVAMNMKEDGIVTLEKIQN